MDRVSRILRAAIVLPVTSPPIYDGALVVNALHIEAVGTFNDIRRRHHSLTVEDLGDVILMPGLVNAHTHLELTSLRDTMPEGLAFVPWLLELVRQKRRLTEDDLVASARLGIAECIAGGVTAVGDITTSDRVMRAVRESLLAGVVFREVIGENSVSEFTDVAAGAMKAGISPHATYTVSSEVFQRLAGQIAEHPASLAASLAIHAAESPEEVVFLKDCGGPIAEQIYPVARWPLPTPCGLSPIAFLESTGILAAKPLLVHGVQVNEEDVRIIAGYGLSVVHCPGSNRRLGVGRFPLELYRRHGVNVALGTDSAIGTKRLDLFEEMREVKRLHDDTLSYEDIIRMATVNGATALGLNAGALEPGRWVDLLTLGLLPERGDDIYHTLVREGCPEAVRDVIISDSKRASYLHAPD